MSWEHRKQIAHERMEVCKECDKFTDTTSQCKECGCVMIIKTLLANSECPLGKWKRDTTDK